MLSMEIADEKRLKEVRFISVSMSMKNSTTYKINGLLVAFRPLIDANNSGRLVNYNDKFIWLFRGNCLHMLSLEYSKIDMITVGSESNCREVLHKPFSAEEQEEAKSALEAIMKFLDEDGKVGSDGLIDIVKAYYEIPQDVASDLDLKSKHENITTQNTNNHVRSGPANYAGGRGAGFNYYNNIAPAATVVIRTALIKRTTKYDRVQAIAKMGAKIKAVKNGTYVRPPLKKLKVDNDDVEITVVAPSVEIDTEEWNDATGYGLMC